MHDILALVSRSFSIGQGLLQSSYDAGAQFRHVVSATRSLLHSDFLQPLVEVFTGRKQFIIVHRRSMQD